MAATVLGVFIVLLGNIIIPHIVKSILLPLLNNAAIASLWFLQPQRFKFLNSCLLGLFLDHRDVRYGCFYPAPAACTLATAA